MTSARTSTTAVDTSGWVTRSQACDLLDVTDTTVANYERAGLLHPQKAPRELPNGGVREVWVYDTEELARIPRRRRGVSAQGAGGAGEVAARAFELFDEGTSLRQVVTALRESPARVQELYDQWSLMGGSDLILGRVARSEIAALVGPFDAVSDLVARLRELLSSRIPLDHQAREASASPASQLPGTEEIRAEQSPPLTSDTP